MGKKTRRKEKLSRELQLSDQHNVLYWRLLDAVAAGLPIPNYGTVKLKYEKDGPLALWVSADGDYKQISFFQAALASNDLSDMVLTNIADRAHTIVQTLTAVLNQQTDKIKMHDDIFTFMEIYAKFHWYAIVKMWEKLDFYRKGMKTKTLSDDTIAPTYDLVILRQHLANLLGFVNVLKKTTSNERPFYNEMMEDITDMMVQSGSYLHIDKPDLLSEQELLSEVQKYKDSLSKPIYYYVATTLYSNDITTLSIGKTYFWKYIDVLTAERDLDALDCKSIGYCAYEIAGQVYDIIKNNIHSNDVSLAEELLHYKEFHFYLEHALHYFGRCKELDEEIFKKYRLPEDFTKNRLSWTKDQIVRIKNEMLAEVKCDAVTRMEISQEQDRIEITIDEKTKSDYVFILSNALCYAKISASVDSSVKNKINIRDMLDTSINKIEDVLKAWQQTLPKENENNSNNQKKPVELPKYDVSRIPNFEVEEETLTITQINRLKKSKNKELEEPSLKEQIKTEVAAKLKKPPKKILFSSGDGRNYVYDQSKETEDDCDVFRLHGQQCKRMYVRINDELYAYLLDQEPELLTMLKKLCKNGTVESDSRGHTCFILSGEEFAEYGQTGMLLFSNGNKVDALGRLQVTRDNANEAINDNENNNDTINVSEENNTVADELNNNNAQSVNVPITRKNITFGKCKIWHEGGRLFGNTVAITPKPANPKKHYHLIEINAIKIKHS